MGVETHYRPSQWEKLFTGKEAELKERLIRIAPGENQAISIIHPDPETKLTWFFYQPQPYRLGSSEILVLDDVIFDNRNGTLTLPFMPEYAALALEVDQEIPGPYNSALSTWMAYGHLLHDQFGLEALYQLHASTRDLPMVFNFYNDPNMIRLVEANWKRPCLVVRENVTRFKRLNFLVHRHLEFKRIQGQFMRKEFAVPESNRLKGFFLPSVPSRRIYLARTKRRKIINDEELSLFLIRHGFEKWEDSQLDQMSLRDQAALFHSAEVIVSPHGSHLANCFFCRPDVTLVELFKFSWVEFSEFATLRSAAQRARYAYLIDWAPWDTALQSLLHADIRVDIRELAKLFEKLNLV